MFVNGNMPPNSLIGTVLRLFKCKGPKASEKDHYRGITLSPIILKVFEMIILNRLENVQKIKVIFPISVGCMETSFLINEAINHFVERGGKFLDVL